MRRNIQTWAVFSFLMAIYKCLLDFMFLPVYYTAFSYMTGASYNFVEGKYFLSCFFFVFFMALSIKMFDEPDVITAIVTMLYSICVVPMLSVYAFVSYVTIDEIIYPSIFWSILLLYFSWKKENNNAHKKRLYVPAIKQASSGILIICGFAAMICWAWAGFPVLLSLADSTAQRIALRANSMPSILAYVFMILGGVVFPYLFARFLNGKKRIFSIIAFLCGFLLFSINGMKTWIFLYLFVIALYILCDVMKDNMKAICYSIVIVLCLLLIFCVLMYTAVGKIDFLSQFGRVFCIPNGIGFRSITFFKDNEKLLLRESILRHFFETPYPGGSDFYLDNGANITVNSARSNNGLWGDAFRNFGLFGMFLYPLIIGKVIDVIKGNVEGLNIRFQIFVLFLMIWNSVNVSLFTWLLTGGVIVVYFLNCFFAKEDRIYRQQNDTVY